MSDETAGLRYWADANHHVIENWARQSAGLLQGAADLAQEVMTFSQSRFQAGLEAWRELLACRSPDEIFKINERFLEKAAGDYFDEFGKLTSHMIGFASPARPEQAAPAGETAAPAVEAAAPEPEPRPAERRRARGRTAPPEATTAS